MHTTEPAISQDAAGQGTAQQPGPAQAGDRGLGHWPGCYRRRRGQRRVIRQRQPRRTSMAMAVLTGVALLYYLGNLFVVCPRPTAASPSDND